MDTKLKDFSQEHQNLYHALRGFGADHQKAMEKLKDVQQLKAETGGYPQRPFGKAEGEMN